MTVYIMYTYCKYILYILLYILNTYSVEYNNVLIWTSWETSTVFVLKEISRINIE